MKEFSFENLSAGDRFKSTKSDNIYFVKEKHINTVDLEITSPNGLCFFKVLDLSDFKGLESFYYFIDKSGSRFGVDTGCTCDSRDLFHFGCKCGFVSAKEEKSC